jgi:hypothetical protein
MPAYKLPTRIIRCKREDLESLVNFSLNNNTKDFGKKLHLQTINT